VWSQGQGIPDVITSAPTASTKSVIQGQSDHQGRFVDGSESLTIEQESGILCRAITANGAVRIVGIRAEQVAESLAAAHELRGDAARIASEGVVATALMSAHIKGDERMTIQVQCSHPEMSFFGEVGSDGAIRGRLKPSVLDVPSRRLTGVLLAIKSTEERELYRGATPVQDQTLTEALRGHLSDSVQVDGLLWIDGAAGVLIERLPDPDGHHQLTVEAFRARYGPLQKQSPAEVVETLLRGKIADQEVRLLGVRSLYWSCRCSEARVLGMLSTLGPETLGQMVEEDGQAEVICHFCNHPYVIDGDQLRSVRQRLMGPMEAP
jgi:molecular chaperone Hsp33